jgi:hypothetical protein
MSEEERMNDHLDMLKEQVEFLIDEIKLDIHPRSRYEVVLDKCEVIISIVENIRDLRIDQEEPDSD